MNDIEVDASLLQYGSIHILQPICQILFTAAFLDSNGGEYLSVKRSFNFIVALPTLIEIFNFNNPLIEIVGSSGILLELTLHKSHTHMPRHHDICSQSCPHHRQSLMHRISLVILISLHHTFIHALNPSMKPPGTLVKYSENTLQSTVSSASAQKPQATSGGGTVNSQAKSAPLCFLRIIRCMTTAQHDIQLQELSHIIIDIINLILMITDSSCPWYYGAKKGPTEGPCTPMAPQVGTGGRFVRSLRMGPVYFFWPLQSMVRYRIHGSHN